MSEKIEVRQELVYAMHKKEVTQAQSILSNNLLWFGNDYSFMKECYQLAKKNNFIFAEYDNKRLKLNKCDWTQEYYYEVLSDLVSNFSCERYEFLIELASYLSAEKDSVVLSTPNNAKNNGVKIQRDSNIIINSEKKSNNNQSWLIFLGGLGILIMLALIIKKMMS